MIAKNKIILLFDPPVITADGYVTRQLEIPVIGPSRWLAEALASGEFKVRYVSTVETTEEIDL